MCIQRPNTESLEKSHCSETKSSAHIKKKKREKKKKRHLRKALETSMELLKGEGAENKLHCAGA